MQGLTNMYQFTIIDRNYAQRISKATATIIYEWLA